MTCLHYVVVNVDDLPATAGWLSDREIDTARSLKVAKRRQDWLLGRYAAKRGLAALTGLGDETLSRWDIRTHEDGAPEAWLDGRPAAPSLSLSHSGGRALCVVASADVSPGCDLEQVETRSIGFVETFFTAAERLQVARASPPDRDLLVTLLWSAKESALKSLRHGLRKDTRSVEVRLQLSSRSHCWQPFTVVAEDAPAPLEGWWRCEARFVLTAATDLPASAPEPLIIDG